MKEKIFIFYSRFVKRYYSEWKTQNSEIDQLRAKCENLDKKLKIEISVKKELLKFQDIIYSRLENKNKKITELELKNHQLNGKIGGLTKYKNKLQKQNTSLQNDKKSLSDIISDLTKQINLLKENNRPSILEIKNMRKNQIRRGK